MSQRCVISVGKPRISGTRLPLSSAKKTSPGARSSIGTARVAAPLGASDAEANLRYVAAQRRQLRREIEPSFQTG